jgi:hypothetical protein
MAKRFDLLTAGGEPGQPLTPFHFLTRLFYDHPMRDNLHRVELEDDCANVAAWRISHRWLRLPKEGGARPISVNGFQKARESGFPRFGGN